MKRESKDLIKKVTLDLWKTSLHSAEIGIRQDEQHRAKSRQFSKDMDIIGEMKEKNEKKGFIGHREGIWKDLPNIERRLVLKLFSASMNWQGTLEEIISREMSQSWSADHDYPSFVCIMPGYEWLVEIEKVRGGLGGPEAYAFRLMGDKDNKLECFQITEKKLSRGSDWHVRSSLGNIKVAEIDSKIFDIGGQSDIKIFDPNLAKNKEFIRCLLLFAGSLKFQGDIHKKIKKALKLIKSGEFHPTLDKEELDLRKNPRLRRA